MHRSYSPAHIKQIVIVDQGALANIEADEQKQQPLFVLNVQSPDFSLCTQCYNMAQKETKESVGVKSGPLVKKCYLTLFKQYKKIILPVLAI